MILYQWMHWFWITTLTISGGMCESSSEPSVTTSPEPKSMSTSMRMNKETSVIPSTSPSNVTSSTSTQRFSFQKSTKNKLNKVPSKYGVLTIPMNSNISKDYTLKDTSVINQNLTAEFLNMSDSQTNANFTILEEANITQLLNETSFNESHLLNSERIGIKQLENTSGKFSAAGITGIFFCCVVIVGIFSSVSYFLYNNRGLNRPQVLNDHCSNPDSSGYLDDASVRDNSEEMYSLDNDSFLNSLEAMTIQNYWTDTVKHTKL